MDFEEQSLSITKYIPPELSLISYSCSHMFCSGHPARVHEALWGLRLFILKNYTSVTKFRISDVRAYLPLLLCLTY